MALNRKAPYFKVAEAALINWNGMSPENARGACESWSWEKLEGECWASGSVASAAKSIGKYFGLNEQEQGAFVQEVLGKTDATPLLDGIADKVNAIMQNPELANVGMHTMSNVVLDTIDDVHSQWMKDNAGQFFGKKEARGQQYQYLPTEMIGWREAKADLLFIEPICQSINVPVDQGLLQSMYEGRVEDMIKDIGEKLGHTPTHEECLEAIAQEGMEEWTPEMHEAFLQEAFQDKITDQLETKGVFADKELCEKLEDQGIVIGDDDRGPVIGE